MLGLVFIVSILYAVWVVFPWPIAAIITALVVLS